MRKREIRSVGVGRCKEKSDKLPNGRFVEMYPRQAMTSARAVSGTSLRRGAAAALLILTVGLSSVVRAEDPLVSSDEMARAKAALAHALLQHYAHSGDTPEPGSTGSIAGRIVSSPDSVRPPTADSGLGPILEPAPLGVPQTFTPPGDPRPVQDAPASPADGLAEDRQQLNPHPSSPHRAAPRLASKARSHPVLRRAGTPTGDVDGPDGTADRGRRTPDAVRRPVRSASRESASENDPAATGAKGSEAISPPATPPRRPAEQPGPSSHVARMSAGPRTGLSLPEALRPHRPPSGSPL